MAGIEGAKQGRLLYHLTKVDNFRSIVRYGLLPRRKIFDCNYSFNDVADPEIIDKRMEFGLDKYTPFHFHPYSAFDVAVKNANNAKRMMYVCVYRERARECGYMILPSHPLSMTFCQLYEYDEGFGLIDWETLTRKNDYSDYAKEVKMAECLTDTAVSVTDFACIFVPDDSIRDEVVNIMDEEGVPRGKRPQIYVQKLWFDGYD